MKAHVMSRTPRSIETQIEINAPVEAVWKALTDAAELANWFPVKARVKPGFEVVFEVTASNNILDIGF